MTLSWTRYLLTKTDEIVQCLTTTAMRTTTKSTDLISKKQICTCSAHFWTFPCRCFARLTHQSIPVVPSTLPPPPLATAGLLPTLSVPGVGHCKFCAALRPGICKQSFWQARGFLSEYNYTEDFTGNTSRLAHLSMTGNCKGMFSILCIQLFIAHQARITWQNRELYTWINVSLVMASNLLILFEEHPLVFIKLFETDNVTAHFCLLKP